MKFAHKLSLAVIVLLGVALSVVGYLTVSRNFEVSLNNTVTQNVEQHLLERYSLESSLINQRLQRQPIDAEDLKDYGEALTGYVESTSRWLGLYGPELGTYYSNLPPEVTTLVTESVLDNAEQGYYLREADGRRVMLISSEVSGAGMPLWLLSVYDVTGLFSERARQLGDILWMDMLVLAVAALFVLWISNRMTRPMRRLNLASRKITSGAYHTRSDIVTDDEIGELSANFNRMAAAVEAQMDQLNASVQQREDFVAAFTHEVKTPMTAIIGYSDILRSQETAPETRQRAAHFIYRESKRLESLSQKLLVLMGLSTRQAELLPTTLGGLFADAARSLIPNLAEYELAVKPADDIEVVADRDLVVDLLRNLVLNGIKAGPKDGTIRIGWYLEDGACRILVADTGRGMAKEELERITEPFYMVDKSRARREGGSGVGLALSQKIANIHGSELVFESEEGVGTTVSFTLQLA